MLSIIKNSDISKLYQLYPYLLDFEEKIFLLRSSNESSILPRYFLENHPNAKDIIFNWKDPEFTPLNIDIEFTGELRKEQIPVMNHIVNLYNSNNKINGILKAKPGFGKTVCAAYLTAKLKKKTLIILDNSKLVDQWKESYLNLTNLTEEDIGFIIGQDFNIKPVTITMVQTLISKVKRDMNPTYKKIRDAGFDLIFFDETHKTSTGSKYALSSLFLNSENIMGLSATPYGDALHSFFMKNIIGEIIYEFSDYDEIPEIYFINYKSGLGRKYFWSIARSSDYIKRIAFYNKVLHNSNVYLDIMVKLSKKLIDSNRKSIIIVSTIDQLQAVIAALKNHNITARPLYSKEQFIDKENDNIIVATYKLASHGFDFKELSCLILGTPLKGKTSLIQTIGRILRKSPNKKVPIVFDLIDHDFGNIFKDTINNKKSIISKEFKVKDFNNINFNL